MSDDVDDAWRLRALRYAAEYCRARDPEGCGARAYAAQVIDELLDEFAPGAPPSQTISLTEPSEDGASCWQIDEGPERYRLFRCRYPRPSA